MGHSAPLTHQECRCSPRATGRLSRLMLVRSQQARQLRQHDAEVRPRERPDQGSFLTGNAFTGAMSGCEGGLRSLMPAQEFVTKMNWRTFAGANGLAFDAAACLTDNAHFTGGVGYDLDGNIVSAGRATDRCCASSRRPTSKQEQRRRPCRHLRRPAQPQGRSVGGRADGAAALRRAAPRGQRHVAADRRIPDPPAADQLRSDFSERRRTMAPVRALGADAAVASCLALIAPPTSRKSDIGARCRIVAAGWLRARAADRTWGRGPAETPASPRQ